MAGLFHEHNLNSYLVFKTFAIYIAYISSTGKKLKQVSIFWGQPVYESKHSNHVFSRKGKSEKKGVINSFINSVLNDTGIQVIYNQNMFLQL